jgi:hypothetical protein
VKIFNIPTPSFADDLLAGRIVTLYRAAHGSEVEFYSGTAQDAEWMMMPTAAELDAIGVPSGPIVEQAAEMARRLRELKEKGDF